MLDFTDAISNDKPSLQVPSLSERIVNYIETLIVEGRIKPGSRIIEETVARELGISRSSLREALFSLEKMGLIARDGRTGRRIRDLDARDVAELYEMWAIVESEAAAMACRLADDAAHGRLFCLIDEMDATAKQADRRTYHRLNLAFHQALVASCPNLRLIEVYDNCLRQIRWAWALAISGAGDAQLSQREHNEIADAFVKRDANKVRFLVREHLSIGPSRTQQR